MGRYLKWSLVGGAVGMLAGTFAFPVFQAWIREFQGLITGLAAVFAASITIGKMDATIRTMERTDEAAQFRHEQSQRQSQNALALAREIERESERRHRQMMALTLRSDRLKVSRLVGPVLPSIIRAIAELGSIISRTGLDDVGSQMLFVSEVENCVNFLTHYLNNPQMKEAYELFDGKLAIDFQDAQYRANHLRAAAQNLMEEIRNKSKEGEPEVTIFVAVQSDLKSMMIRAQLLKNCLEEVRQGLSALADLYLSEGYALGTNI